ncbi:MAG: DUF2207 domain-containing protein [Patescibacteria group bacterium]|nr:DUF2207 domain-containing protein [Patescibacteria group bacterium]
MKLKSGIIRFSVIAGATLLVFSLCRPALADTELINNFNVGMVVQSDGSILVSESITYNFGANEHHGIYRDIPLTSPNGPNLSIVVVGVTNESGQPYQYTVSKANNILEIKIGDPNALVNGVKTYVIHYRVYNAIRQFSDHQEIYWNATGNDWQVGIQNARASILLPYLPASSTQMACFTGSSGSAGKDCSFSQSGTTINYSASRQLGPDEGLTIVLGLPSNYITSFAAAPAQSYGASAPISYSLQFWLSMLGFLVVAVLIASLAAVRRNKGMKPSPVIPGELRRQPVVVAYNPPDDLRPIEIECLLDRKIESTGISAVIIDLAVRGYLKIRYISESVAFVFEEKSFELVKMKDGSDLVLPADQLVFNFLFAGRDSVKLNDLKKHKLNFVDTFKDVQNKTEQLLTDKGYFDQNREKYMNVLKFLFSQTSLSFFKKLTPTGLSAVTKIMGFKEFLQLTEKDKLALLDAPNLEPQMFERFLPYAMVLGVEDKWAAKFENIYNITPVWYENPGVAGFNSVILMQNMALFNNSFNNVFSAASSSGFSGGFSGGGSGGGGGGSW